ncbi:undecaprenyl-diphosphate phosphatase [Tropicimonas isoalkanivorans]|uniref:Undecaprenyl-diphosphatase n=1 Tax=Tropicimonas isoalkanivorans TaxID=441112 RepID=A0A1I1LWI2_9RHOB|nr:undecaprenyl-diphosphate phosphatase [Tropicimonas isoalkanivorans]SFC77449.1 Undecaprenyl-diphosphatase [Tropicimonas isoalkanivorans]
MTLLHILLVAIIQGVTEFLPISSSGHLILLPSLSGMEDQGQAIDVAVHVGTLFAVVTYFWTDVREAAGGLGRLVKGKVDTSGARLALMLIVATIPVILLGLILDVTGLDDAMRSVALIGWTMLLFGIVLYWADQKGDERMDDPDWTMKDAWIMGLWQALALIPGTSRSGITITGGRLLGYTRHGAAKLSMLMSIPTIMASGLLLGAEVAARGDAGQIHDAAIAAVFAFLSALLALTLMMRLLRSVSFTPYVIYRIVLGLALLGYAYL